MNEHPTTLKQRVDVALQQDDPITSADIAALIGEAEAGIAKADEERAVDQAVLSSLQARYKQVQKEEQATGWLVEHHALKRERDALAEELRQVYPDAAAKIVDLFVRISANKEALSALHLARPTGILQHLLSAELHARGLDSFTSDMPSLLTSVHLLDFDSGRQSWPPRQPSIAEAFAATMVPSYGRGFSADWAKDNEARTAAQQAERQRMGDYYARAKKEQEDRQNAEARERFMAQQQTISRTSKP